jgi:hypothetical protein
MRRRVVRAVRLDLDDPAADAVHEQLDTDQVRGDLMDVPREEAAADQNS